MILLITEKPSIYRALLEKEIIDASVEVVFTFGIGLWDTKIERIKFSQIPFTDLPLKEHPKNYGTPYFAEWTLMYGANSTPLVKSGVGGVTSEVLDLLVGTLRDRMKSYSKIIVMPDADRRGCYSAQQLLDKLGCGLPPVYSILIDTMETKVWRDKFKQHENNLWGNDKASLAYISEQKIKKIFEYWWNTNASLVFSELCKFSSLNPANIISKYELMVLNCMHIHGHDLNENQLFEMMESWAGTGKYSGRSRFLIGIGSPSSRSKIIENAIDRGAIRMENGTYRLTKNGCQFINMLHPRSFDSDLPYRLEEWMTNGSIDAMRKYIRTIFGRQLKYQRSRFGSNSSSAFPHQQSQQL